MDTYNNEQDNPLLSWDELKQMKRKPIWIEDNVSETPFKQWGIIQEISDTNIILAGALFDLNYPKEKYGTHWQAYKKER